MPVRLLHRRPPAPATNAVALTAASPPLLADPTALAVGLSPWLLALLIAIPAVYLGLAARPTRSVVARLFLLALGWPLIEAVLHLQTLLGPQEGLLTASQSEGLHLHWLARLMGYIAAAFLVSCANASLIGVLSGARLSFLTCWSFSGSPNVVGWCPSELFLAIQSWTVRQARPRAPPIPVADPSWPLVASPH